MSRFVGPLLIVLLAGLALLSLRGGPAHKSAAAVAAEQPRYIVRNAQLESFNADGQVQFTGEAATINYYDDESARLNEFEITALAGKGAPWTASAPQGYAPPGSRHRLQLLGGVDGKGRWPDGEALTFKAQDLWVDTAAQTLETDSRVQLDSRTRKASGRGLAVSSDPARVRLLHEVELRYAPG